MGRRRQPPPVPTTGIFEDHFNTGALDTTKWTVSTWNAPQGGKFQADRVSCAFGMLGMRLTQDSNKLSIGGEITLKRLCGFGTYEWQAKASSTAPTPNVLGSPVSGSVTGLFNYVGDSDTELDLEVEGCRPNLVQATTWHSVGMPNENTQYPIQAPLSDAFHSYKYVWAPGKVQYYFNGILFATHTRNVPTAPAYPMINHWGTNNANWGGVATPNVDRWLWVSMFRFTPL